MRPAILSMLIGVLVAKACAAQTSSLPQPGDRDCAHCPEIVRIPPGSFLMGAAPGKHVREGLSENWATWELPQHKVVIGYGFSLGRYEVTRGEYAAFVQATGRAPGASCNTVGPDGTWRDIEGRDWRNPGFAQTDRDPVVCVSWDDAKAYVAWLSQSSGKKYRLPSEAEWEYAARAGTAGARFWGERHQEACRYANVDDASHGCRDGYGRTAPAGTFQPNPLGLHDMLGNAWEWNGDCWNGSYAGAPTDGSPWHVEDCKGRVLRGGAWVNKPWYVRAASRVAEPAAQRASDFGFRVVRSD